MPIRLPAAVASRITAIVIGALCAAGPAAAQQRPYIDPVLRTLLDPATRSAMAAVIEHAVAPLDPRAPGVLLPLERAAAGAPVTIGVLMRLRDAAGLAELRDAGASIGSVVGDIATARVPLDALARLADARSIARIDIARVFTVQHDESMSAIRADAVRRLEGDTWVGATGRTALVGVYDTGLDLRHADFIDAAGHTRVAELLDQNQGTDAGLVCTRVMIQATLAGAALCPQRDLNGHGTHVTGTAAGNGSAGATPFRYPGVAPGAELLIVNGRQTAPASFTEDRVIDGLVWLRDRAAALGRPIAVNLSFGAQLGPHDGSRLAEQVIDMLSGPGFIVVIAAGNEGHNFNLTPAPATPPPLIHARGIATVRPDTFSLQLRPYASHPVGCNIALFSLWHHGADRLTVTFVRANGTAVTARHGEIVTSNDAGGRIHVDNASAGPDPDNHEHHIYAEIGSCDGRNQPTVGSWHIHVAAAAPASGTPFDIWMWAQAFGFTPSAMTGTTRFDNRFIVATPGTAERAITVGAFVTKLCWPARTTGSALCPGDLVGFVQQEPLGDIARFSTAGPTRSGQRKPEITAPGIGIMSSLSGDLPGQVAPGRADRGGAHWLLEGTSTAAPHVTGAIALLLEQRGDLTPEEAKAILATSARHDQFTASTYGRHGSGSAQDWWGAGKLDVQAALHMLTGDAPVALLRLTPAQDTLPQGATVQLRADAFGDDGQPRFGRPAWVSLDPDVASVDDAGLVHALRPGTAVVVASADAARDSALIHVVPPAALLVTAASAAPDTVTPAPRGARLPLLSLRLETSGAEAITVRALAFDVTGHDPAARVLLLRAADGVGDVHAGAALVAATPAALRGAAERVLLHPDTLHVRPGTPVDLLLAVELSGDAPHLSAFQVGFVPDAAETVGARSGAADRLTMLTPTLMSEPVLVSTLAPGRSFALSENPVRSSRLFITFTGEPGAAAVYTPAGARVADLSRRIAGAHVAWDLTNDAGVRVAPGVYLLIFEVGGHAFREKLYILSPAGQPAVQEP